MIAVNSIIISFLNADKENYKNYYELSLKLLRKGGIIAIDNVLWDGYVVDENNQVHIVFTFYF